MSKRIVIGIAGASGVTYGTQNAGMFERNCL